MSDMEKNWGQNLKQPEQPPHSVLWRRSHVCQRGSESLEPLVSACPRRGTYTSKATRHTPLLVFSVKPFWPVVESSGADAFVECTEYFSCSLNCPSLTHLLRAQRGTRTRKLWLKDWRAAWVVTRSDPRQRAHQRGCGGVYEQRHALYFKSCYVHKGIQLKRVNVISRVKRVQLTLAPWTSRRVTHSRFSM